MEGAGVRKYLQTDRDRSCKDGYNGRQRQSIGRCQVSKLSGKLAAGVKDMSIKMQVPVEHATAQMTGTGKKLRARRAQARWYAKTQQLLADAQWRMLAWVRGEYLLREYREVAAQDAAALTELLDAVLRGNIEITSKTETAVRIVHGSLLAAAEIRTKANMSSLVDYAAGKAEEAIKQVAQSGRFARLYVKSVRKAIVTLSRCRLPACKLSRAEKERILVEYASHIKGDKTSVRVANSLTGKAGYDARARIQWYQIQPEMKRIMKHSALLTCTQNQEDKERLAVDVRVMANLGTPYTPEREQFLKLVTLRSLLQFRQTSREQYTRPHGVRVVAPVRERMWAYLTWESIIEMNKELDFGQ